MLTKRVFLTLLIVAMASSIIFLIGGCNGEQDGSVKADEEKISQSADSLQLSSIYMINETIGWGLDKKSVLRTVDGGEQWIDTTPPGGSNAARDIIGDFLDADTAWLAIINDHEPQLVVFSTVDGGKTWHGVEVLKSRKFRGAIYGASIDFIDREHGWLLIEPEHGMSARPGELFATSDGGKRWSKIANSEDYNKNGHLPFSGKISFSNISTGWVARYQPSSSNVFSVNYWLYKTIDGGHNWQQQKLEIPPGYQPGDLGFAAPVFFPPKYQEGILSAMAFKPGVKNSEKIILYITDDGGTTWQPRKPVEFWHTWEFADVNNGWAWIKEEENARVNASASVNGVLKRTLDGGINWNIINPDKTLQTFLGKDWDINQLDFVSSDVGWILMKKDIITKEQTGYNTRLLKTIDGGHSWKLLNPRS